MSVKVKREGGVTYYGSKSYHKDVAKLLAGKAKNDNVITELNSLAIKKKETLTSLIGDFLDQEAKRDKSEARAWLHVFKQHLGVGGSLYFSFVVEGYTDLQYMSLIGRFKGYPPNFEFLKSINDSIRYDYPVLIVGETGTSKELVARVIHNNSERSDSLFHEINCAAIPETMLEDELFGHEKGAFTGAVKMKKGRIELAEGGTIFLDELGKMPTRLQAKILKVVEDKKVYRLGSDEKKPLDVDVRFVAALQPKDVTEVLPDLIYRMGYPDVINLPTVNQRLQHVPQDVLRGSLRKAAESLGTHKKIKLSKASYSALVGHHFEGNYRELENILRYAIKKADTVVTKKKSTREWHKAFKSIKAGESPPKATEKKEIIIKPYHFEELLTKTENAEDTDNFKTMDDLVNVKLKNIIEYADAVASEIIERKICEIKKCGMNVRQSLAREGLIDMKDYENFIKKIRQRTRKGIREIG